MKKTIIIGIVLLTLLIGLVSAEEISYIYNDRSDIDLTIPCYDATNALCDASTNCNISIKYPDSSILVNDGEMTHNDINFNYTIKQSYIERTYGEYHVNIYCVGSDYGHTEFIMNIKPDSLRDNNYVIFIIIGIFVYGLLIFSILREEYALGMIASMAIIIIGIYVYMYGIIGITNWITDTFALINIVMGAYIFLRGTTEEAMQHLGG